MEGKRKMQITESNQESGSNPPPAKRQRGFPYEEGKGFFGLPWKRQIKFPPKSFFEPSLIDLKVGGSIVDPIMLTKVAETAVKDHNSKMKTNSRLVKVVRLEQEKVCGVLWYLSLQVKDEKTEKEEIIHKAVWQGITSAVTEEKVEELERFGFKKIDITDEETKELGKQAMEKFPSAIHCYTLKNFEVHSHYVIQVEDGAGYLNISKYYLTLYANEKHIDARRDKKHAHKPNMHWDVSMSNTEWLHTLDDKKALIFAQKIFTAGARPPPLPQKQNPPNSVRKRQTPQPIRSLFDMSGRDLDSSLVETSAWFTIMNHNLVKNKKLEFVKVLGGYFRPNWGKELFLTLQVKDKGELKTCKAKVRGNPWPGVWIPSFLTEAKERRNQYLSCQDFYLKNNKKAKEC